MIATKTTEFRVLESMGFSVARNWPASRVSIQQLYEKVREERDSLGYEIDGLVISINDREAIRNLGVMDRKKHAPRAQVALKFPARGCVSTIREIFWSFEGAQYVSPVAIINPIEVSGATIGKVSLKSLRWMQSLAERKEHCRKAGQPEEYAGTEECVGVGSVVEVVRSGDVIPKIQRVVSNLVAEISVPTHCPECGASIDSTSEARPFCVNRLCPCKEAARLNRFLKALRVKGLAHSTLLEYTRSGVTLLDWFDHEGFERVSEKAKANPNISNVIWAKIKTQLENANSFSNLPEFLDSLSIQGGGQGVWEVMVEEGHDLESIRRLTPEQLALCGKDVGRSVGERAYSIIEDLHSDRVSSLLDRADIWYQPKPEGENPFVNQEGTQDTRFEGKSVCMTGEGPWERRQIKQYLESIGARVVSAVSGKTDILMLADPESTTTKARKARSLGIQLMSYEDALGPVLDKENEQESKAKEDALSELWM